VVVAALSFDGDRRMIPLGSSFSGCLVLQTSAPFISSDTVRFSLHTQGTTNRVKHFFSDYFTVRPDPRLGDEPPAVTMTTPVGGESFPGGSIVPIVWTAVDDEAIRFIDIQASFDGGRTWHLIAEELPPATTSFDWQLPPSGGIPDVRVRVMASDLHFQTSSDGAETTFAVVAGAPSCDNGMEYPLVAGWNMVGPGRDVGYTASALCSAIGASGPMPVEVDALVNGGWLSHRCGLPFNDFPILPGEGYFVRVEEPTVWCQNGPPIPAPAEMTLDSGWSAISLPEWANDSSAESLCAEISNQGGTPVEVDLFVDGGWVSHVCGLPFNDFPIVPGEGYLVKSAAAAVVITTW
jgi:hypothetical protein